MFMVYGVVINNGVKHRYFIGSYETLYMAKHMANCATGGNASYAYVKEIGGNVVFFLTSDPYVARPLQHPAQANHPQQDKVETLE